MNNEILRRRIKEELFAYPVYNGRGAYSLPEIIHGFLTNNQDIMNYVKEKYSTKYSNIMNIINSGKEQPKTESNPTNIVEQPKTESKPTTNIVEQPKTPKTESIELDNSLVIPVFGPTNADGTPAKPSKPVEGPIFVTSKNTESPSSAFTENHDVNNVDNKIAAVATKIESILGTNFPGYTTIFKPDAVGLYHGIIYDPNRNPVCGYTFDVNGKILNHTSKWFPIEIPNQGLGYEDHPVYDINNDEAWIKFIKKEDMSKVKLLVSPYHWGLNKYVDLIATPNMEQSIYVKVIEKLKTAYSKKKFLDPEFKTKNRYRIISASDDGSFIMRNDCASRFAFDLVPEPTIDVTVN